MDHLLVVKDLEIKIGTTEFQLRPLRGVSFNVRKGQTLCVVGESGCGKSLTALAISGLLPRAAHVSQGEITLSGRRIVAPNLKYDRYRNSSEIGFIFQDPMTSLNPLLRVGRQIVESYIYHGLGSREDAIKRSHELLEKVGIPDPEKLSRAYPHELSGGLRQRVVIATSLMCSPKLLIADEPTTALDVITQAQILDLINNLKNEFDMGILFITHDLGVVQEMADRVAVMYAGEIVETGSKAEVLQHAHHPYTKGLMRSVPLPHNVTDRRLETIPGTVPIMTEDVRGCPFVNRCAQRLELCRHTDLSRIELSKNHSVACHAVANKIAETA